MDERKHTPGPWQTDNMGLGLGHIRSSDPNDQRMIAYAQASPTDANAARIVACVNALEGIEDPAAFVAAVRELVEAARSILAVVSNVSFESAESYAHATRVCARLSAALAKVQP
jgi:hypothetical protein